MASFDRSHTSSYSPSIVPVVSFARYSDLLVENREIFIPHLYLAPPQWVTTSKFRKMFDAGKTRVIGLLYGEKNCDDMLSRFHHHHHHHFIFCTNSELDDNNTLRI